MTGLQDVSFESEAKIRKALVSISIATLVLSNVELASDTLNFFGLEIIISLDKISAVFRLSILILLLALFLVLVEHSLRKVVRALRTRDEKWWNKHLPAIREFQEFQNGGHGPSAHDNYNEYCRDIPEWDDQFYEEKFIRKQRRTRLISYFRSIAIFSKTLTRYVFPVGLAILALAFPQSILILS